VPSQECHPSSRLARHVSPHRRPHACRPAHPARFLGSLCAASIRNRIHPWAPGPSLSESARPCRRRRDELPAGRVELDGYVSEKVDGDDKAERSTYPPREEPHAPHARAIDPARAPAATTTGEPVAAPLAIPRGRSDPFVTGQARHVVATCNDRLPLWWSLGHGCS